MQHLIKGLPLIDLFLFHYFLLSIRLYVLSCHVDVMIHSHTDQWIVASCCCSSCHHLFSHRVISYVLLYIPVAKTFCSTRNPLYLLILLGRKKEKKKRRQIKLKFQIKNYVYWRLVCQVLFLNTYALCFMVNHLMWNFFQVLINRSFQPAILSNLQR